MNKNIIYLKEDETIKNNRIVVKRSKALPIGQSYIKKKGAKRKYFKSIKNSK